MPVSTDNQDYGESDKKNNVTANDGTEEKLTSDDLKGKKVDADLSKDQDKPAEQPK